MRRVEVRARVKAKADEAPSRSDRDLNVIESVEDVY